jgi:IS605 OrfB family transposase
MGKDDNLKAVFKVKLHLTKEQKKQIRKWEGIARFTYNKSLEYKKQFPKTAKTMIRNKFVTKKNNPFFEGREWLSTCPKAIRQQAVFEMAKNYKVGKDNCRFKKFGAKSWSLGVEKSVRILQNNKIRLFSGSFEVTTGYFGTLPQWLKPFDSLDEVVPPNEVLIHFYLGDYFLIFPHDEVVSKVTKGSKHMVGLDPGIRKFMTSYGSDGKIGFFGRRAGKTFLRKQWYKDFIDSQLKTKNKEARITGKSRKSLKKKRKKIQKKIESLRHDLHHQLANWLTRNYGIIAIGKLPKSIISRNKKLPTTVKRAYNALAHYKFRCILKDKCLRRGIIYLEVNEHYTSKSCTHCGRINEIGTSEVYKCDCSSKVWDRDVNGARNILLKTLSESYLRIVPSKGNKAFTLEMPLWTLSPKGYSLTYDILQEC